MAKGDVKNSLQSVAAGAVLDIKPPSGEEWVIHNIYYHAGPVEINIFNGTLTIKADTDQTAGGRFGAVYHVTSTQWLQIKNTSGAAIIFGYDGIQTK